MAQTATRRTTQRAKPRPAEQARPAWAHGTFYWNELMTRDVEGAKRFYKGTIGWGFDAMPTPDGGTYWLATSGGRPAAGIFELTSPHYDGVPEGWMPYLAVDDVDKRLAKAVKAGAKLMKPIFDVPGVGRIAIVLQPGGAGIGWMTPEKG